MARIALQCACGWRFFITGSFQGWETACPSCGSEVRVPGRRVKGPFGTVTLPKANLRFLESGKGLGLRFPGKLEEAEGKLDGLAALLAWCADAKLKVEGDYVAFRILAIDPANPSARAALNLKSPR